MKSHKRESGKRSPTFLFWWMILIVHGLTSANLLAQDGNRLAYLDEFLDPYYVGRDFPRLTTPQWVGEDGVEAVVVLAIDDMRATQKYEQYLRPILERLKQIDGRAPVSIMTCNVDPNDPQLKKWLNEGLSIDVHTVDHPCPILQGGDFAKAKSTYDRCVDLLAQIPGNKPVAFRTPCCDSLNTPSPRLYAEIINKVTPQGNFLSIDSSVFNILTPRDPALPRELVLEGDRPRFRKYLPFPSFVNTIEDYPYPYVIGRLCWEFPCLVPSDWEAQNLHKPNNPRTVADMMAALDAVVLKQGTYNLVFHPHGWIRNDQIVELIDYAVKKHGDKVKFLTFREAHQRLVQHLLAGQPLRATDGKDNGVRVLDVNGDGFLDVAIGNENVRQTRIWQADKRQWQTADFPVEIDEGVRFGILDNDDHASFIVRNDRVAGAWHFDGKKWQQIEKLLAGLTVNDKPLLTSRTGADQGVRLRDLDNDGRCELLGANDQQNAAFSWNEQTESWRLLPFRLPPDTALVDAEGRDAGLRFADIDEDGFDDVVFSNEQRCSLHLFSSMDKGWSRQVHAGKRGDEGALPMIARQGANNGAWFHSRHMWVQNEDTNRMPNLVDRRSFDDLTKDIAPRPKTPDASRRAIEVAPHLQVELVAAEPLVMDPVGFDWGTDGRLWVVEMADYPLGLDDQGKPGGRVRFLTDSDGDGKYDKSTVFLDGLNFPSGIMTWRKGVLITAAPEVFYAEDTDGDGRADHRETLYVGFGEGNQQHRVNGLKWGLDNWVHLANGDSGGRVRSVKTGEEVDIRGRDLRIRPDTGQIQPQSGQTQHGRNRDDWGNWFGTNNPVAGWHYALRDHYLRRNVDFAPPNPRSNLTDQRHIFPISRLLMHWEGYRPPPAGSHHLLTSACSLIVYRDNLLGNDIAGNMFFSEPAHNLIQRRVLVPHNSTFRSQRPASEQTREFLASRDPWFRPNTIRTGPDGAIWFADIYREVIEHPKWIDDQREKELFLRNGHNRGRIYRVRPVGKPLRKMPRFDRLATSELVSVLESPNGWQRDTAQMMLLWRADKSAVEPLRDVATTAKSPLARLHALCTLDGLGGLNPDLIQTALNDDHPGVRRHAIRLCEPLPSKAPKLGGALIELASRETDPQVRLQLAYSLGQWKDPRTGPALAALAIAAEDDPYLRAAVMSSVNQHNRSAVTATLLASSSKSQAAQSLLVQLLPSSDPKEIASVLETVVRPELDVGQTWRMTTIAEILLTAPRKNLATVLDNLSATSRRRLDDLAIAAQTTIESSDNPPSEEQVVAAVRLVGSLRRSSDVNLLVQAILPRMSPAIQTAAVKALSGQPTRATLDKVFANWSQLTPAVKIQVLDVLLARTDNTRLLLDQIKSGTIPASHIDTRRRQQLITHTDESIRTASETIFSDSPSTDRAKVVESFRDVVKMPGSAERGKAVFGKRCATCHQLDKVGHRVGPDLAAIINRSPANLLVAMLDPNRAIEARFLDYRALTDDGRIFTGMLIAETATSITLQGPEAKQNTLLRRELDDLRSTGKSIMPEGFEKDVSRQDLADLFAYLAALDRPAKSFPGNKPRTIEASRDGILTLPASAARIYGPRLVLEQKYGNLGWWENEQDHAVWSIVVPKSGRYRVELDYACASPSAGSALRMEVADRTLRYRVVATGTWDDYRSTTIGHMTLDAGPARLICRSDGPPRRALIDLRTVRLVHEIGSQP